MSTTYTGGCLCEAVRYEFDGEPQATVHCHCRHCQKVTGSGFTTVLVLEEKDFRLQQGADAIASFKIQSEADRWVAREFCRHCGSALFTRSQLNPGAIFIKAGSLDDSSWVQPTASCWTSRARPWAPAPPGVAQFGENPG